MNTESSIEVVLSDGQNTSMQVIQQVYKDVTGKSERLSKTYSINHQTIFSDLEGLHRRLEHILEQYCIVQGNCTVILSHTDDSSERYSSFERARGFDAGSAVPTESIDIEYQFLIILPVAKKPEKYKIRVNLRSRASLLEKIKEMDPIEAQFSSLFASKTAMVSIEYVDYAVARNIFREIDHWINGLAHVKNNSVIRFIKSKATHMAWILRYATATIVLCVFMRLIANIVEKGGFDYVRFGLFSFGTIYVASGLAAQLGMWLENLVNGYQPLSYLRLNRGDEQVIRSYEKSTKSRSVKALISCLLAIGLNIAASWVAIRFGIH